VCGSVFQCVTVRYSVLQCVVGATYERLMSRVKSSYVVRIHKNVALLCRTKDGRVFIFATNSYDIGVQRLYAGLESFTSPAQVPKDLSPA